MSEPKLLLEAKYEFVTKVVTNPMLDPSQNCIDSTVADQLRNYYKNGVYGTENGGSGMQEEFHVGTEGN